SPTKQRRQQQRSVKRWGYVLDVDLFEIRPRDVAIMKIKVNVDVSTTLRQTIRIVSPDKKYYDILLRYEKLGVYCRCCGFLGHETRNCDLYLSLSATGSEVDLAWRADLKADQVGWRIIESKENNNPNWRGRNAVVNSVHKKPTPVSLIRSFAKLSCSAKSGTNNSEEDDSVSSAPIILAPQPLENSTQLPFQVGSGHAPEVKRNKRQKLKHMARRRTLGEGLPNVSGVKRAIEEAELQGEFGENGKMVSCNADKGVGANPYMAPQTS
ncbi:hypothetical protein PIB30_055818, partial [Stylosanthes scabra]|nr:hypothetical protein [Stylosanthes scabra]